MTALGLNIYVHSNKLLPKTVFQWSEIRHITYDDKKFTIKPVEKGPNFVFYSQKLRINKVIFNYCMGNHQLFMKRRRPDTMEVQQMKAQAKEENQRRLTERIKLCREMELRTLAESDKKILELKLKKLQEDMLAASECLKRTEETAEMYAEKSRIKDEEVILTQQKAYTFQKEMERLKKNAMESEKEKVLLNFSLFV